MDSGNSGSMQSSSGGDDEYDSSFLNNNPNNSAHFGSISSTNNHNNQVPPQFLSHQPNFFDPHSQNIDTSFNNELIWSRGLRSDHHDNFNNFGGTSSASSNAAHQVVNLHHQNPFSGSTSLPIQQSSIETTANVVRASNSAQPDHHQPNVAKNPKKRTRASRRAPTTVLTTDTTNFRQMVQEFTGIPTAPFTGGSPYSRRLDLFSTAGSAMRSSHLDSLGPLYPLRPSAQKVQVSPFMPQLSSTASSSLLSSSMIDALMPTNNTGNNSVVGTTAASTSTSASASASANFQLGSDRLGIPKQGAGQNNNMFNMQNQILSFQPLVQSSASQQLGISHDQQVSANLSGFQGQVRNDGNISRLWRSGGNNNAGHDGGQENQMMRSFDGHNNNNSSSQHVSGYKLNCSAANSTSEFHPEKGLENVCNTTGDQGPVSSWTCPSE